MSPFDKCKLETTFTEHIEKQISCMVNNEARVLDIKGRPLNVVRVTINRCAKKLNYSVRTKTDIDGNLWIKRFK